MPRKVNRLKQILETKVIQVGHLEIPDVIYERTTGRKINMAELVNEIHKEYRDMYDIISMQTLFGTFGFARACFQARMQTRNWYVNTKVMRYVTAAWMRYIYTGERTFKTGDLYPFSFGASHKRVRMWVSAAVSGGMVARVSDKKYTLTDETFRVMRVLLVKMRDLHLDFYKHIEQYQKPIEWQQQFWEDLT